MYLHTHISSGGMNNKPVGGHSLETWSHFIDINGNMISVPTVTTMQLNNSLSSQCCITLYSNMTRIMWFAYFLGKTGQTEVRTGMARRTRCSLFKLKSEGHLIQPLSMDITNL
jgi:hypothetical protein